MCPKAACSSVSSMVPSPLTSSAVKYARSSGRRPPLPWRSTEEEEEEPPLPPPLPAACSNGNDVAPLSNRPPPQGNSGLGVPQQMAKAT